MVKIRLRRMGAPKKPSYRVVVADSHSPRDGAFIGIIGRYNPLTEPETVTLDEQAALEWLKKGAQPTETVARLFKKAGIMDKLKAAKETS
jgi:small subunit ribosomal protein S16